MLEAWRPINAGVNAIAESLGAPVVYPFDPTGTVVDKLEFVCRQISGHVKRARFYRPAQRPADGPVVRQRRAR